MMKIKSRLRRLFAKTLHWIDFKTIQARLMFDISHESIHNYRIEHYNKKTRMWEQ